MKELLKSLGIAILIIAGVAYFLIVAVLSCTDPHVSMAMGIPMIIVIVTWFVHDYRKDKAKSKIP